MRTERQDLGDIRPLRSLPVFYFRLGWETGWDRGLQAAGSLPRTAGLGLPKVQRRDQGAGACQGGRGPLSCAVRGPLSPSLSRRRETQQALPCAGYPGPKPGTRSASPLCGGGAGAGGWNGVQVRLLHALCSLAGGRAAETSPRACAPAPPEGQRGPALTPGTDPGTGPLQMETSSSWLPDLCAPWGGTSSPPHCPAAPAGLGAGLGAGCSPGRLRRSPQSGGFQRWRRAARWRQGDPPCEVGGSGGPVHWYAGGGVGPPASWRPVGCGPPGVGSSSGNQGQGSDHMEGRPELWASQGGFG